MLTNNLFNICQFMDLRVIAWTFIKKYFHVFQIQNMYLYLKYISQTSIYILYHNKFPDPVSVFCIKIHSNVFKDAYTVVESDLTERLASNII